LLIGTEQKKQQNSYELSNKKKQQQKNWKSFAKSVIWKPFFYFNWTEKLTSVIVL
jgi:trehalose-6-phosphate synthase